jgi:hypothetical protein
MNLTTRCIAGAIATGLAGIVPAATWTADTNHKYALRKELQTSQEISEVSAQKALQRSRYCLNVNPAITDNTPVVYPHEPNRKLPAGSVVCDAYGNTAIVDSQGKATDIQSAPREQLSTIIQGRKQDASAGNN